MEQLASCKVIVMSEEDIVADMALPARLSRTQKDVIVTQGINGVLCYSSGKITHVPCPQVVNTSNPTGAGDMFASCLFLALFRGLPLIEAVTEAQWFTSMQLTEQATMSYPGIPGASVSSYVCRAQSSEFGDCDKRVKEYL